MKKAAMVWLLGMSVCLMGYAQSLEREAYLSGGDCATVGSIEYVFSFGEAVIGTDQSNLPSLTMGFQQPMPVTVLNEQKIQLQTHKLESDAWLTWILDVNHSGICQVLRMFPGDDWEVIGEVEVQQQLVFEWLDAGVGSANEGVSYQIRWEGLDGQQAFSDVQYVYFDLDHSTVLRFFPNPARDQIQLQLPIQEGTPFSLLWYNAIGQLVGQEERKFLDQSGGMGISTQHLARGSYVLVALYPGGRKQGRILLTK